MIVGDDVAGLLVGFADHVEKWLAATVIADMDEDSDGWVSVGGLGDRLRNAYPTTTSAPMGTPSCRT